MNNPEKFKGQTVGIILYILLSGDRHTDELKELIDTKFAEVKIGTLYSIITRMKTQELITEYRASSNDGSRRKYYKITELGTKNYNENYAELFADVEPIVQNTPQEEISGPEQEQQDEINNVFLDYVRRAETDEFSGDIDFSSVVIQEPEQPIPVQQPNQQVVAPNPVALEVPNQTLEQPKRPVDFDTTVGGDYEYNSVLKQLFPKNIGISEIQPEIETTEIVETATTTDFSSIYEFSERENIKIRTSGDTNRYQGTKILDNKLRFHSAVILLILSIIEYLVLSLIFVGKVEFSTLTLGKIAIVFGIFAVLMLIIYLLNLKHSVKDLPKFINVFEISLVITIAIAIIAFAVASINGIDYQNVSSVFNMIILPIVLALNCPIYVLTVRLLSNLDIYHTV